MTKKKKKNVLGVFGFVGSRFSQGGQKSASERRVQTVDTFKTLSRSFDIFFISGTKCSAHGVNCGL